jgi:Zn-dependent M28 family amino/carboxypeptidase
MKITTLLLVSSFVYSVSFAQSFSDSISSVSKKLHHYVSALAHDSMQGRATGTSGMIKAADFISDEMKVIGLSPVAGNHEYMQMFPVFIKGQNSFGYNVMGALQGDSLKDEIVIISAHYDHIGLEPGNNKDSVYNGANDDASGVAAVLFLAAELKKIKLQRTVVFIAFSGEEIGLSGSEYLVSTLDVKKIIAVFNFEMLGRGNSAFLTGSRFGTVQEILNNQLFTQNPALYGKRFFKNEPYQNQSLFSRSDNYSFALKGIPAHTIMVTPDYDQHYHKLTDEAETLDYELMAKIATASLTAIEPVINGRLTPKRIKINNRIRY